MANTQPSALPTAALDYRLPSELVATRPVEPRDSARMLVMHRGAGHIEHRSIRDLPEYVDEHDALVFNTSAVIPARLVGRRHDSGGAVEGLFLGDAEGGGWRVMLKSNGRLREGIRIDLLDAGGAVSPHAIELRQRSGDEWRVVPLGEGPTHDVLHAVGRTPLPPYILRARGDEAVSDALDRGWYQTVYADAAREASVAAPTAGLHFTPDLLERIEATGASRIDILLHVGPGTFKPVTAEHLDEHEMHSEDMEFTAASIAALRRHRERPRNRTIAVGTTSVRALESLPSPLPDSDRGLRGPTSLLIAPPHEFRHVDGMLTNFHLPRSTLLALVAAMVGLERIKAVYAEAIERRYRFYSYGDAMLILP